MKKKSATLKNALLSAEAESRHSDRAEIDRLRAANDRLVTVLVRLADALFTEEEASALADVRAAIQEFRS